MYIQGSRGSKYNQVSRVVGSSVMGKQLLIQLQGISWIPNHRSDPNMSINQTQKTWPSVFSCVTLLIVYNCSVGQTNSILQIISVNLYFCHKVGRCNDKPSNELPNNWGQIKPWETPEADSSVIHFTLQERRYI